MSQILPPADFPSTDSRSRITQTPSEQTKLQLFPRLSSWPLRLWAHIRNTALRDDQETSSQPVSSLLWLCHPGGDGHIKHTDKHWKHLFKPAEGSERPAGSDCFLGLVYHTDSEPQIFIFITAGWLKTHVQFVLSLIMWRAVKFGVFGFVSSQDETTLLHVNKSFLLFRCASIKSSSKTGSVCPFNRSQIRLVHKTRQVCDQEQLLSCVSLRRLKLQTFEVSAERDENCPAAHYPRSSISSNTL